MTARKPRRKRFAALEDFCLGYLHQDLAGVHGTVEAAMDAFVADASSRDLARLARDWRAFEAHYRQEPTAERLDALEQLGCSWRPAQWAEVEALFARLELTSGDTDSRFT
ncbi:MAG: contact-dependent growth inhibition system immunity protein [Vicinamibacterales bacterium]